MASTTMDVLEQEHVQLGVSFDLVPGVRLARADRRSRRPSPPASSGCRVAGCSSVVVVSLATRRRTFAASTASSPSAPVGTLPMFDAPLNAGSRVERDGDGADVAAAVQRPDAGDAARPTWPLVDYVHVQHCSPARVRRDRRSTRRSRRVGVAGVGTDGTLYHRPDAYVGGQALGIRPADGEILGSDVASSLPRDQALVLDHGAVYLVHVRPLFESPRRLTGP